MRLPQGRQTSDLTVFELDQPSCGDTRAVKEGGMLKRSGLLNSNVKIEACVSNLNDPN